MMDPPLTDRKLNFYSPEGELGQGVRVTGLQGKVDSSVLDNFNVFRGSSVGIGAVTAVEFAKEGASVVLVGRNSGNLDKTAKQCQEAGLKQNQVLKIVADLHKQEDCVRVVDETLAKFGRIDILVNNAGWLISKNILETTIDDLDAMFNVFIRAAFTITNRALPSIIANKGAIINVSSTVALIACGELAAYSIAKAALDHYTRLLALELAEKGVRVNCINPGITYSHIFDKTCPPGGANAEIANSGAVQHPARRAVETIEIAKAILFLASEDALTIMGASLPVNGGWHLLGPTRGNFGAVGK